MPHTAIVSKGQQSIQTRRRCQCRGRRRQNKRRPLPSRRYVPTDSHNPGPQEGCPHIGPRGLQISPKPKGQLHRAECPCATASSPAPPQRAAVHPRPSKPPPACLFGFKHPCIPASAHFRGIPRMAEAAPPSEGPAHHRSAHQVH